MSPAVIGFCRSRARDTAHETIFLICGTGQCNETRKIIKTTNLSTIDSMLGELGKVIIREIRQLGRLSDSIKEVLPYFLPAGRVKVRVVEREMYPAYIPG
jgi:hypothetical protein